MLRLPACVLYSLAGEEPEAQRMIQVHMAGGCEEQGKGCSDSLTPNCALSTSLRLSTLLFIATGSQIMLLRLSTNSLSSVFDLGSQVAQAGPIHTMLAEYNLELLVCTCSYFPVLRLWACTKVSSLYHAGDEMWGFLHSV